MHSPVYLAICVMSLGGMLLFGTPDLSSMVIVATLAIAVLGVPHGGLDHWTGKRFLQPFLGGYWWVAFFPAYLLVGASFAAGWFIASTITVLTFFIISAWHFGREEQLENSSKSPELGAQHALVHITAIAMGGLVIWIPALVRADEMRTLLRFIIPVDGTNNASLIVEATQWIAIGLLPIAALAFIVRLCLSPRDLDRWVPLATAAIAISMPILISFPIYFCGWHSWQGLQRLRRDEALSSRQFVQSVAPLSIAAIVGVAVTGWWMQGNQSSSSLQTLFIGLSAIAVPHLFLHELCPHRHPTLCVVNSPRSVKVWHRLLACGRFKGSFTGWKPIPRIECQNE
jgi:Brp/Blh family beta-carotene 15,15'-monooxygenase